MGRQPLFAILTSLVLLFGGIVMVVLVYVWLFWYITRRQSTRARTFNHSSQDHQQHSGLKQPKCDGLSESDLKKLPTKEFQGEVSEEGGECAVCLDAFCSGDVCRVMPACGHSFHVTCADQWLSQHSICPLCRANALLVVSVEPQSVVIQVAEDAETQHE